jgi:hypothetical protein
LLKCAPFGLKADKKTHLVYESITPTNQGTRWQHVSCGVYEKYFVQGEYLVYDINELLQTTNQRLRERHMQPKQYTHGLSDSDLQFVFQPEGDTTPYQISIGGNQLKWNAKDVRVWTTLRESTDLFTYRFM